MNRSFEWCVCRVWCFQRMVLLTFWAWLLEKLRRKKRIFFFHPLHQHRSQIYYNISLKFKRSLLNYDRTRKTMVLTKKNHTHTNSFLLSFDQHDSSSHKTNLYWICIRKTYFEWQKVMAFLGSVSPLFHFFESYLTLICIFFVEFQVYVCIMYINNNNSSNKKTLELLDASYDACPKKFLSEIIYVDRPCLFNVCASGNFLFFNKTNA